MALDDWDWRYPVNLQDVPWDCAAASLTWCLNAAGLPLSEAQVVAGLGPARISPAYGLLDASGAGIVDYLQELGIGAANDADASWDELIAAAGYQPMLIGGREWCHWSGVRISPAAVGYPAASALALANPAPGWCGVHQVLTPDAYDELGSWSAVWFTTW